LARSPQQRKCGDHQEEAIHRETNCAPAEFESPESLDKELTAKDEEPAVGEKGQENQEIREIRELLDEAIKRLEKLKKEKSE